MRQLKYSTQTPAAATSSPGRVLVVDDHPAARTSVIDVLRLAGYAVEGLASAVEALPLLDQREFDVVITDLQMPGIARVHTLYGPKGVQVIGVALDDDRKDFRFNLEIREITYPCYSEFNGWGSSVAKAYEVKATPTIVLIDAERRIVAKPYDVTELEAELVRLLGQP